MVQSPLNNLYHPAVESHAWRYRLIPRACHKDRCDSYICQGSHFETHRP